MRFLVTAGPTHEAIDPVRYIANASSGKMGFSIAREARRRGHQVILVAGPTTLRPPKDVTLRSVVSAAEMRLAVQEGIRRCHCLVMAAAVSDYRPARTSPRKIPKGSRFEGIRLVRNPDILREAGRRPGERIIVGFSLETERAETRARRKMREKGLDFIIQNSPSTIGKDQIACKILFPDGSREVVKKVSKPVAARKIVRWIETLWEERKRNR